MKRHHFDVIVSEFILESIASEFILESTVPARHLVCFDNQALGIFLMAECFGAEVAEIHMFESLSDSAEKHSELWDDYVKKGWAVTGDHSETTIDCDGTDEANLDIANHIRSAVYKEDQLRLFIENINKLTATAEEVLEAKLKLERSTYTNFGAWS